MGEWEDYSKVKGFARASVWFEFAKSSVAATGNKSAWDNINGLGGTSIGRKFGKVAKGCDKVLGHVCSLIWAEFAVLEGTRSNGFITGVDGISVWGEFNVASKQLRMAAVEVTQCGDNVTGICCTFISNEIEVEVMQGKDNNICFGFV